MMNYIMVFLGAGAGGTLRYWLTAFVHTFLPTNFPFGTLTVNFLGSFLIGIFMYLFASNELIDVETRVFLTTGFCGGLTTFSTFSFETLNMIHDREFLFAGINIFANILITLLAVFIAYKISNVLTGV